MRSEDGSGDGEGVRSEDGRGDGEGVRGEDGSYPLPPHDLRDKE